MSTWLSDDRSWEGSSSIPGMSVVEDEVLVSRCISLAWLMSGSRRGIRREGGGLTDDSNANFSSAKYALQ